MSITEQITPVVVGDPGSPESRPFSYRRSLETDDVHNVSQPHYPVAACRRMVQTELELFTDREKVAAALEMDPETGACPLPGHYGTASLELLPRPSGEPGLELRFVCNCCGTELHDGGRSDYHRHLADAYHAIHTERVLGRGDVLDERQRAYWRTRLAADVGMFDPEPLDVPEDADELLRRAADHFALISGRARHLTGSPVTRWPRSMVARNLGVTDRQARDLIERMVELGVIIEVRRDPDTHRRRGAIHYRSAAQRCEPLRALSGNPGVSGAVTPMPASDRRLATMAPLDSSAQRGSFASDRGGNVHSELAAPLDEQAIRNWRVAGHDRKPSTTPVELGPPGRTRNRGTCHKRGERLL